MKTNTKVTQSNCHTTIAKAEVIKLGLDVHARQITVCRRVDDSTPQPPQRFVQAQLISWVKVRMAGGAKLYSCYEARPLGYGLHRELTALVAGRSCAAPPGKATQFSLDPVPAADILRASRFRIWNLRPH